MRRKRKIFLEFIFLCIFSCRNPTQDSNHWILGILQPHWEWEILFSYPGRDSPPEKKNQVRNRILKMVSETKEELFLYIYGLTDPLIIDELVKARNRGVRLHIVADKERDYSLLREKQIPYSIWNGSGLHHPKILISDRKRIFTGTGNFTTQGLLLDFDSYFALELPNESYSQGLFHILQEKETFYAVLGGVLFLDSPRSGLHIQKWILDGIRQAKESIQYLIYAHYDPVISFELIRAARRGVRVEGIYNRPIDPEGKQLAQILPKYGSQIYEEENEDRLDNGSFGLGGLLHHKTMIIDKKILFTGSYNYSRSARDTNREIFQVTMDPKVVQEHIQEFERVRQRSRIYHPEDSSLENLPYFLEWGEGIFHSLGVTRNLPGSLTKEELPFLSISSGMLSFPQSQRRNLPLFYSSFFSYDGTSMEGHMPDSMDGFFQDGSWANVTEMVTVRSWNPRTQGGVEFHIQPISSSIWSRMVFWSVGESFYSVPLQYLGEGRYWASLPDFLKNKSTGMMFFQDSNGIWGGVACFVLGNRIQPEAYQYLIQEMVLQNEKQEYLWNSRKNQARNRDIPNCSQLNRGGVGF